MLDLRAALAQCPIAAILRGVTPDEIDAVGDTLVEAGITIIEVPLNSPNPFESIKRLAARHGSRALVGAGTGLGPADGIGVDNIRAYKEAGASGYGIGSALYKPGRSAAEIGTLARALVAAARTCFFELSGPYIK